MKSRNLAIDPDVLDITKKYDEMLNHPGSIDDFRKTYREIITAQGYPEHQVNTTELSIATRHGDVPCRLYSPKADAVTPLIVYMHGGGFMVGDLECVDIALNEIAFATGISILSIEYALAPEEIYPIALEQCWDIACWASDNLATLGCAGKLGVAGDSAGGNLAALLSLRAKETGRININWQCLINAILDFPAVMNATSGSLIDYAEGPILNTNIMKHFISNYFSTAGDNGIYEASPLHAMELAELPPAFIAVGEFDALLDDSTGYHERLLSAGVESDLKIYPGMVHNFITMTKVSRVARSLLDDIGTRAAKYLN